MRDYSDLHLDTNKSKETAIKVKEQHFYCFY